MYNHSKDVAQRITLRSGELIAKLTKKMYMDRGEGALVLITKTNAHLELLLMKIKVSREVLSGSDSTTVEGSKKSVGGR